MIVFVVHRYWKLLLSSFFISVITGYHLFCMTDCVHSELKGPESKVHQGVTVYIVQTERKQKINSNEKREHAKYSRYVNVNVVI